MVNKKPPSTLTTDFLNLQNLIPELLRVHGVQISTKQLLLRLSSSPSNAMLDQLSRKKIEKNLALRELNIFHRYSNIVGAAIWQNNECNFRSIKASDVL